MENCLTSKSKASSVWLGSAENLMLVVIHDGLRNPSGSLRTTDKYLLSKAIDMLLDSASIRQTSGGTYVKYREGALLKIYSLLAMYGLVLMVWPLRKGPFGVELCSWIV